MRDLEAGDKDVRVQALLDLLRAGRLQEEFHGLSQIGEGLLDRGSLAHNIQLWTQSDITVSLTFKNSSECALIHFLL